MHDLDELICQIDLTQADEINFKSRFVGCLVLTQDYKILLQQRGDDWDSFPGGFSSFGGRIEDRETPLEAVMRELYEELGAKTQEGNLVNLGAVTEAVTHHTELIYEYFWHDKLGEIAGCYEGEAIFFDDVESVLNHRPSVMDDVHWVLRECQRRQLL